MAESDLTIVLATNWQAVSAVAAGVYAGFTGVALLGVLFIWKQLKATNRARTLEALNAIYTELHSDQAKADRAAIYDSSLDQIDEQSFEQLVQNRKWGRLELISIERTADTWHHVGLLADKKLVQQDVLFTYFAWPLLNSYKKMKTYITLRRAKWNPDYAGYFISLAAHFEKRYKEKNGEERFSRDFGHSTLQ